MHVGVGGISLPDKRPPCYAAPEEAIRVPVRPMNFNSRRRIEFVKSFMEAAERTVGAAGGGGREWKKAECNGIRETSGDERQLDL